MANKFESNALEILALCITTTKITTPLCSLLLSMLNINLLELMSALMARKVMAEFSINVRWGKNSR